MQRTIILKQMEDNSRKISRLIREGKRDEANKIHEENMRLREKLDKLNDGEKLVFR